MQEHGLKEKRFAVEYFEGVNSLSSHHVSKRTELRHAENARSVNVGSLEKRAGQTVIGTDGVGNAFVTSANYGIFNFENSGTNNKGLYRFSADRTLTVSVVDTIMLADVTAVQVDSDPYTAMPITIRVSDGITLTEVINGSTPTASATVLCNISYLDSADVWTNVDANGLGIIAGQADTAEIDGRLYFVNGTDNNRYIESDGKTVVTSATASGNLWNSPKAKKICFYKNRIYLGNFTLSGIHYGNSIVRSSEALGVVGQVSTDVDTSTSSTVQIVTDDYITTLFDTTAGANKYDIYRGITKITTMTCTSVEETSITGTFSPNASLKAGDYIYIQGTYDGEKKYKWASNQNISGSGIKRYSTLKLSGGANNDITMMTNIGNVMMIGSKTSLATWNDYSVENFDLGIGCCSLNGYVKTRGTLYFLDYSGIYSTSGSIPKLISNKVERYINGATKAGKEAAAAGKKGKSIFFAIGDVTLYNPDGSTEKTLSDVCLEFNLTQENWFVHTNVKASQFATFIDTTDTDRLVLTDNEGNMAVKEFLSGETDDGQEIFFRVDLNRMTLNPLYERLNNPIALIVDTERGNSMKAFVSINEGSPEFYEIDGVIQKGISVLKITDKDSDRGKPPACRLFDVSIRDSSKQICKIKRVTVSFLDSNQDAIEM